MQEIDFFEEELDFLYDNAKKAGINLKDESLTLFADYAKALVEANKNINLTAITKPRDIAVKHFIDSIYPIAYNLIDGNARLIDIGCGAGMPGLPLKFALPDISLTLADSLAKRIRFIDGFIKEKKLAGVIAVSARAEELAMQKEYRETFDVVTSRAVSRLNVLCEYCLPFLRIGGIMIAYKGADVKEEIRMAENAVKILGGGHIKVYPAPIEKDVKHCLVVIEKVSPTPSLYPRRTAKIVKIPL